ncbi:hypothetical protein HYV86_05225 [Candidatus Woesearchaeota archaeon]|nr:hypothetical protein [Candidatus Woesearchaeota archaeon]
MPQLPKEAQWLMCLYCHEHFDGVEWNSMWVGSIHYKTHDCGCGVQARCRVDFIGSGHDAFRKETGKLESMLKPHSGIPSDFPKVPFPLPRLGL